MFPMKSLRWLFISEKVLVYIFVPKISELIFLSRHEVGNYFQLSLESFIPQYMIHFEVHKCRM